MGGALNAARIGVTVNDGMSTLVGWDGGQFAKKSEAEETTEIVAGVKAGVEKIEVRFGKVYNVSDEDIAKEVLNGLKWNGQIPNDKVFVKL